MLEISSPEKDLVIMVDRKLSMTQQCALVAKKFNGIVECISKSKKEIVSLYSTLVMPYQATVSSSGLQNKKGNSIN